IALKVCAQCAVDVKTDCFGAFKLIESHPKPPIEPSARLKIQCLNEEQTIPGTTKLWESRFQPKQNPIAILAAAGPLEQII
ncbi:MAG: hypothetical protein AAFN77_24700, partial [Planctomycetota bacterium]